MSTVDPTGFTPPSQRHLATAPVHHPFALGLSLFAGTLMILQGVLSVLAGISALLDDGIHVPVQGYVYAFDLTTWGWIHIVLGVLVAAAGAAVYSGRLWGRIVGIVLVGLHLVANFLFLPQYPWWSVVAIALDLAVIWALSVSRAD